jgi:hypothetical protein
MLIGQALKKKRKGLPPNLRLIKRKEYSKKKLAKIKDARKKSVKLIVGTDP